MTCSVALNFEVNSSGLIPHTTGSLFLIDYLNPILILWVLLQSIVWLCLYVRMAERSKALRSGRSPVLWARVRIPLLTYLAFSYQSSLKLELLYVLTHLVKVLHSKPCRLRIVWAELFRKPVLLYCYEN